MIWVWAGLLVLFLVLEGVTAGLVSIWFAAGAAVSLVVALISEDLIWLQVVAFIVVSAVTLLATRPLARKLRAKNMPTNADRNIGSEAVVTADITAHVPGSVKVNGMEWTAVSDDGADIPAGEVVIVKDISGVKVTVAKKATV